MKILEIGCFCMQIDKNKKRCLVKTSLSQQITVVTPCNIFCFCGHTFGHILLKKAVFVVTNGHITSESPDFHPLPVIDRLRIQIVIHHAVLRHFLILRARLPVVCVRVNGNPATRREFAPYFNVAWVHQLHEVV